MVSALSIGDPDGCRSWNAGAFPRTLRLWTTPEARESESPWQCGRYGRRYRGGAARQPRRVDGGARHGRRHRAHRPCLERWGRSARPGLIGDFAFAIWDVGRVHCSRQGPLGMRPFYYTRTLNVPCSRPRWRRSHEREVLYRLNPQRVADHLVGFSTIGPAPSTVTSSGLPAGHTLTVSPAGTRLRHMGAGHRPGDPSSSDDASPRPSPRCSRRLRAVACGAVTLSRCLLSGGLDTSSIGGTARRIGRAKLDTFTAIFPGLPATDLRMIDEWALRRGSGGPGGLDRTMSAETFLALRRRRSRFWHLDEVFARPEPLSPLGAIWCRPGRARQGATGRNRRSTTVSHGLERLPAWRVRGDLRPWAMRCAPCPGGMAFEPVVCSGARCRASRPALLAGRVPSASRSAPSGPGQHGHQAGVRQAGGYRRSGRGIRPPVAPGGPDPPGGPRSGHAVRADPVRPGNGRQGGGGIRYRTSPTVLRSPPDGGPCLALPAEQKLRDGWSRSVMRRAMAGALP